jgi:hypothetical protein
MVLGRPTPSLCRGLLRLANDVLSAINWPGRRPGTTINTDAAEESLYDYMEYAIEEFVVYEDCDEMDYADERSGLGVMGVVLIPELTRHVLCELMLADEILAGGGPESAAGGSKSSRQAAAVPATDSESKAAKSEEAARGTEVKKIKPKKPTIAIIKDLQAGVDPDRLPSKHFTSASNIRQIASRLERGEYDLPTPNRPRRDTA